MMVYVETGAEGALHVKTRDGSVEVPAGSTWDWETGVEKDNTASDGDCDADALHVSSATMTPAFSADDVSKKIQIGSDYKVISSYDSATKVGYEGPVKTGTGYDVKVYGWNHEDKLSMGGLAFDWTTIELLRGSYLKGHSDNGLPTWIPLFSGPTSSTMASIYYDSGGSIIIVRNAYWNKNTELWNAASVSYNAQGLMISGSGISVLYKSKDDGIAGGWTDGAGGGGWTSGFKFGHSAASESADSKDCLACAEIEGEMYEKLIYSLSVNNPTLVNDNDERWTSQGLNFRNKWDTAPSTLFVVVVSSANWTVDPVSSVTGDAAADKWGFRVSGYSDVLDAGESANSVGYVECY
jgi:hypothetical protein